MDEDDTAMSYQEWNDAGYYVIKGSKSPFRDIQGVPQFTLSQVAKKAPPTLYGGPMVAGTTPFHQTLWERCEAAARAKGTPWGVVEDFDSFVREAGTLPTGKAPRFNIQNPMERHFMEVADKHGILDAILDGDEDDFY